MHTLIKGIGKNPSVSHSIGNVCTTICNKKEFLMIYEIIIELMIIEWSSSSGKNKSGNSKVCVYIYIYKHICTYISAVNYIF